MNRQTDEVGVSAFCMPNYPLFRARDEFESIPALDIVIDGSRSDDGVYKWFSNVIPQHIIPLAAQLCPTYLLFSLSALNVVVFFFLQTLETCLPIAVEVIHICLHIFVLLRIITRNKNVFKNASWICAQQKYKHGGADRFLYIVRRQYSINFMIITKDNISKIYEFITDFIFLMSANSWFTFKNIFVSS